MNAEYYTPEIIHIWHIRRSIAFARRYNHLYGRNAGGQWLLDCREKIKALLKKKYKNASNKQE